MIRAVIDANVVISAMLVRGSCPWQVVTMAESGFTLVWSPAIVAELARVVRYAKLQARFQVADPPGFLGWLVDSALLVTSELPEVDAVHADPSDDVYLATALAGAAPYLVTGDRKHLLAMKEFAGVRILTPRAFLAVLKAGVAR